MTHGQDERRHVVIIGGGFGGLEAARRLKKKTVRVSLVDRHNYHLFQPLLYQVATGGLAPSNIATPLRYILRRQANCEVLMAEVTDFDLQNQRVIFADGYLEYDDLIVAAGSAKSYFGNDQWRKYAPGLKSIPDAIEIRRRVFVAFEAAERETDPEIRRAQLTFVVVGGGPTGVELAGALSEISKHTLKHDFRHIHPEDARIVIVEAAEHVLAHYPEELCRRAADKIRSLGIEILTGSRVIDLDDKHVRLSNKKGEQTIATRTVLWGAGVKASPLGRILSERCGVEPDRSGRVPVSPRLTVGECENVFVIGDLANFPDEAGQPLPGLAPVAIQQGAFVARNLVRRLNGKSTEDRFGYRDKGTMATIGRAAAVAQLGKRQLCGYFAWLMWLFVHLLQIVQFQNRVLILMQWIWNYFTFHRSSRLITREEHVVLVDEPHDEGRADEPA